MLKRVIYTSHRSSLGKADLPEILSQSTRNNEARGITGVLLESDGHFLQVIEGEEAHIEALVHTLKEDKRHRRMQILHTETIELRTFGAWSMVVTRLTKPQLNSTIALLSSESDVSRKTGLTYLKYLLTASSAAGADTGLDAPEMRLENANRTIASASQARRWASITFFIAILLAIGADIGFFMVDYLNGAHNSVKMLQSYALAVSGLGLAIWATVRRGEASGLTIYQGATIGTVALHALWAGYGIHAPSLPFLGLAVVTGILSDKPGKGITFGLMSVALIAMTAALSFAPSTAAAFTQPVGAHHAILANLLFPLVCLVILGAYRQQKAISERFTSDVLLDLAKTIEQLKETMVARDYFFSAISHEIRTPMHGAISAVQVISHPKASDATKARNVEVLRDSLSNLNRLLDDLLDVSRLESGKFKLYNAPFDINQVTRTVIKFFTPGAAQAGTTLSADLLEEPLMLLGDQQRYRQMLSNFLGNAIKFTQNGKISIKVERIDDMQSPLTARWRCEVSDTGIGIAQDELNELFKPFSQASQHGFSSTKGSGMGLAIVAGLAKQMQGDAGVSSVEGEGSTFWFTFAMPIAGRAALPANEATRAA